MNSVKFKEDITPESLKYLDQGMSNMKMIIHDEIFTIIDDWLVGKTDSLQERLAELELLKRMAIRF